MPMNTTINTDQSINSVGAGSGPNNISGGSIPPS